MIFVGMGMSWGLTMLTNPVNLSVSLYPSCSLVSVSFNPHLTPLALPAAAPFSMPVLSNSPSDAPSTHCVLNLSCQLHQLIQRVSWSSIGVSSSKCYAVVDTRATYHMLPDKTVFILYKAISNLQKICMGNNLFVPALGCGTTIFFLNGQCVLI